MKTRYKLGGGFLAVLSAVTVAALLLSGVHVGNRVFTVKPERFEASGLVTVTGPAPGVPVSIAIAGRVTTLDGRAVAGAMVTAADSGTGYRLTVYSDVEGHYRLEGRFSGNLSVRARAPGFQDAELAMQSPEEPRTPLNFALEKLQAPDALSESLAASAHAAMLDWPNADLREAFVSQCHFCHQIGNALTRVPRDGDEWAETVDRMDGYLVMLTERQKRAIGDALAAAFNGDPVAAVQTYDASPELSRARIEEWPAGDGYSFIHDADVGADGRLYGVDEGHDVLWVLDRETRTVERVPLPGTDLPVGGVFSGLALPIGIFSGKHGPHSLAQAADGRFWITNALSASLMSYEPHTKVFETYAVGGDSLYPHTIRIDGEGIVWFTIAASNQVARFEPDSGRFTIIELPSNGFARWVSDAFFPLILKTAALVPRGNLHLSLSHHKWFGLGRDALNMPYGIDVNPLDGSVWYAKLYANRIGRIDPETLDVVEFETPLAGPRRPRFDRGGTLWIPSFDESSVLSFDPASGRFSTYPLPQLAPNEYETPYALNVHPQTGDVWITSNLSDRIFRFDPDTQLFVSYPSPTRVTFLRDLVFTDDGKVCSSQSNLPAYAIEGGVPSFICIDPG